MKLTEQKRVLMLANSLELSKRVLSNIVGNDLSTRVDGQDVAENSEVLIATKLREKLALKG